MNKLSTMTKKNLFTLLAAVICCMATFTVTSCSVDDSAIYPDEKIDYELTGKWLADISEEYGEQVVALALMSFDTDGVVNICNYIGFKDYPYDYWEHNCRHGVYWIDKATKTIYIDNGTNEMSIAEYEIKDNVLILTQRYDDEDYEERVITFHRPTYEEQNMLKGYDESILGDEYVGRWLRTYEEDGQTVYVVVNFTSDLRINRYTVDAGGKVTRSTEIKGYYEDSESITDRYMNVYEDWDDDGIDYWWKVQGKNLYLGYYGKKETLYSYHMITRAEDEMIKEFENAALNIDLNKHLLGDWYIDAVEDEDIDTDSRHLFTYEADGTVYYTPSIKALKNLNIWGHHFKGSYTINGNTVEQQVALADKNILFTQQMNVKYVDDARLKSITNAETFVNGESRHVVKDENDTKLKELYKYDINIVGVWGARLLYGTDENYEKDKSYQLEFKADGTFKFYSQNEQEEWVEEERVLSEYFVEGNTVYTRWQKAGSDEVKYQSWEYSSYYKYEMDWSASRKYGEDIKQVNIRFNKESE